MLRSVTSPCTRRRRAFWLVGSLLASRSLIFFIPLGALFRSVYGYQHGTVLELVGMNLMQWWWLGTTRQWWRFLEQERLGVPSCQTVNWWTRTECRHRTTGTEEMTMPVTSALNAGKDRFPDTDNCVDGQRGARSSQRINAGEGTSVAKEKAQGSTQHGQEDRSEAGLDRQGNEKNRGRAAEAAGTEAASRRGRTS